jgi:hypothetical protein
MWSIQLIPPEPDKITCPSSMIFMAQTSLTRDYITVLLGKSMNNIFGTDESFTQTNMVSSLRTRTLKYLANALPGHV